MKYVGQRKNMAMGDGPMPGNTLSVPYMGTGAITHPDRNMDTGKTMQPSERMGKPPVSAGSGRMAKTGEVDHGPHNYRYVK